MPDMASAYPSSGQIDAMSAIYFDTISGVKKLANLVPAITYLTSAFEPSSQLYMA